MAFGQSRLLLLFCVTCIVYAVSIVDTSSYGISPVDLVAALNVVDTAAAVGRNRREREVNVDDRLVPKEVRQGERVAAQQRRGGSKRLPRTVTFTVSGDLTPFRKASQDPVVLVKDESKRLGEAVAASGDPNTWLDYPYPAAEDQSTWLEVPDPVAESPLLRAQHGNAAIKNVGTFVEHANTVPNISKASFEDEGDHRGVSPAETYEGPSIVEGHKGPSAAEFETKTSAQEGYPGRNREGQDRPGTEQRETPGVSEVHQVPEVIKSHAPLHDGSNSQEKPFINHDFPGTESPFLHSTVSDPERNSTSEEPLLVSGAAVDRVYTLPPEDVGPGRRWIAYFHDQAIAIILQEGDGTIVNCTLREVITVGEQRAALAELGAALPLVPVSFHHMVHLVTLCGALDQLSEQGAASGSSSAGKAWWLFFGTNILAGILPGTLWCGMGDQASHYHQLGPSRRLDRCCRAHDHCPIKIRPHTRRYGVANDGWNTKSHCACDLEFHRCLKESRTEMADTVGRVYFNYLQVRCLQEVSEPPKQTLPFSGVALGPGDGRSMARHGPVEAQEASHWEANGMQRTAWSPPWQRRLECARWDRDHLCRLWLSNPRGNTVRLVLVPPQLEY